MLTMDQINLKDQFVLIREDFNVPIQQGKITHTARIDAALPTVQKAIAQGAKILLMSHLGRPVEGKFDKAFSLQPIADYLTTCLKQPVTLFQFNEPRPSLKAGEVALLENVRFLSGEESNAPQLAKQLANLCQVFVMDAFAVAHRAQASTCGVAEYAPLACAGPLLQSELTALNQVLKSPAKPVLAIVGGSKVSTKLNVLTHLLEKVEILVVGGGIANTFLAAKGYPVGNSLYEPDLIPVAKSLLNLAEKTGKEIWLPEDVIVSTNLSEDAESIIKRCSDVQVGDKIGDIGPQSCQSLNACIARANTILWNGPMGVFELTPFSQGTKTLANAIANSQAFSVAGGGDTLSAIEQFQVTEQISYLSTGGGAFLEVLEGKVLPAVAILEARSKDPAMLTAQ